MARFKFENAYAGFYDTATNTFTPSGIVGTVNKTATNGVPRQDFFAPGDTLVGVGGGAPSAGTYLARTTDGLAFIVHVSIPTALEGDYLLTNSTYASGNPITTIVDNFIVCFLTGTRIATPGGERSVETLEIGDIILTADGSTRAIRWIGRQSVVSVFANPLRSYPICIAAGALGERIPTRDLFISPDHALLVDGVLVQAGALVNNTSITRVMEPGDRFTYYHIETDDHALILAEGTPAETFIDNVSRRTFDNYTEYAALYGEETVVSELDLPRAMSVRQVPRATRERLAAVAATLRFGMGIAA